MLTHSWSQVDWKGPLEVSAQPSVDPGRAGSSGPCSGEMWMAPRMEISQPLSWVPSFKI